MFVSQLVDGVIYVARRLAARERKIAAGGRGSGRFAYLRRCRKWSRWWRCACDQAGTFNVAAAMEPKSHVNFERLQRTGRTMHRTCQ